MQARQRVRVHTDGTHAVEDYEKPRVNTNSSYGGVDGVNTSVPEEERAVTLPRVQALARAAAIIGTVANEPGATEGEKPVAYVADAESHICARTLAHSHTRTCAHAYSRMCARTPALVRTHTRTCAQPSTPALVRMHTRTCAHAHSHMCARTLALVRTNTCTSAHTHSHICARTLAHSHSLTLAHVRTLTRTCAHAHLHMCDRALAHVRTHTCTCAHARFQDQTFAVMKGVFFPHSGAGPNSPMEFHAILTEGLKNLSGGMELLWQLANYDFEAWLDGCVSSSFAHYK
eukprot:2159539-Pleurochrysis_carterae.AAC.1